MPGPRSLTTPFTRSTTPTLVIGCHVHPPFACLFGPLNSLATLKGLFPQTPCPGIKDKSENNLGEKLL